MSEAGISPEPNMEKRYFSSTLKKESIGRCMKC